MLTISLSLNLLKPYGKETKGAIINKTAGIKRNNVKEFLFIF